MALRLVTQAIEDVNDARSPTVRDVEAEAARRLTALGYDRHLARRTVTGTPMPTSVTVKHLQIMGVALAMARLKTIPDDYRSDIYWPVI